ncbi:nicotinic acid mononucleotide adenyltransferase [Winogradskyella sp. DF17]|uniref:Nicotinic acid mononucleotide adenyltransferase n=1 Tax=Winogradskyella pelagia TaxID=2819984 RepID=A0ABS3T0P2_9FLAO|nr:nicotinic acid mononucleotide adenyltransferase [Winogradskyella sp. DF17]MBO3115466.1 nicotinic acid mononucleotide adenyltransferase [Winogradskyella sp. DF17]
MKKIVVILVMLCVGFTYAQKERTLELNKEKDLIEVVYYHDNGTISQTGFYTKEGKLHGEWFSYCEQGNKIISAKYYDGKKVGKWFYWNNDTLTEVDYSNNVIAGINKWTNSETSVAANE